MVLQNIIAVSTVINHATSNVNDEINVISSGGGWGRDRQTETGRQRQRQTQREGDLEVTIECIKSEASAVSILEQLSPRYSDSKCGFHFHGAAKQVHQKQSLPSWTVWLKGNKKNMPKEIIRLHVSAQLVTASTTEVLLVLVVG